ncbi:hypothetical protein DPMN_089634 [Dreissena polymorpha]|uniref:Uncharacterized protein n=1 Tax=Dreissena polymorpha TaxID=45954 RepID=A0A9D4KX60_DREPO|nr:hypothetical protein DPMN_089634 [Dreissena polymorpha]
MAEGGIGCTESETGCSNLYSRHSKVSHRLKGSPDTAACTVVTIGKVRDWTRSQT